MIPAQLGSTLPELASSIARVTCKRNTLRDDGQPSRSFFPPGRCRPSAGEGGDNDNGDGNGDVDAPARPTLLLPRAAVDGVTGSGDVVAAGPARRTDERPSPVHSPLPRTPPQLSSMRACGTGGDDTAGPLSA